MNLGTSMLLEGKGALEDVLRRKVVMMLPRTHLKESSMVLVHFVHLSQGVHQVLNHSPPTLLKL
jgi:hypothetical protein